MRHTRNSFGPRPQGYCIEKTPNLEKSTSSAISILLLIYDQDNYKMAESKITFFYLILGLSS